MKLTITTSFMKIFIRGNLSKKQLHVFDTGVVRIKLQNSNYKYVFLYDSEQYNANKELIGSAHYRVLESSEHQAPPAFSSFYSNDHNISIIEFIEKYQNNIDPEIMSLILFNLGSLT